MLQILLLGAPVVLLNEQPVLIRRRLQRSMLFYLASQPEPVGRSELMELFWPEEDEQDGRRHLREALSKLRAQLDDPRYWLVDQDRIGLNAENVYVDVREFQQIAAEERHLLQNTPRNVALPTPTYHRIRAAEELWRSNRFLAGATLHSKTDFDNWLSATSQELENTRLMLLERLGFHFAASGDLLAAISSLRRALELDDLNETIYYQILTWQRSLGLRSEMIKTCAQIEAIYARENEGPPPPMLQEICRQIRAEAHQPRFSRPVWPQLARMHVPFVGRIYALEQLARLIQRGGAVMVFGEAGAGKTRLVQHFYESQDPAPRLLLAQARSAESSLPFQPLIEMLRSSVHENEWQRLDPVWLTTLSPLMPELLRIVPARGTPVKVPAAEGRGKIFEALRQLLPVLDGAERILLFLDDAQWSDQATLSALAYLQERKFFHGRGLLMLAARQGEHNPSLEEFLGRSYIEHNLLRLTLRQLSTDEIRDMVSNMLNQVPPEKIVTRLVQDTGGNPLFIIETLRAWLDLSPRPDLNSIENLPLASSMHSLLHERLRALSQRSRGILQAAAVIGHTFTLDLVEQVAEVSSEQLMLALEDLERYYLIRPEKHASPAAYAFIHEKFREVLLQELGLARRRVLHRRAAQALQALQPAQAGAQAAVFAGHFEHAGDARQAFQYWLEAAEYARSLQSFSEAFGAYQHAEDLLPQLASTLEPGEIYALYSAWGAAATEISDTASMHRVYASMHAFGEQHRNPLLVGAGLSGIGYTAALRREVPLALGSLQQAMEYLEQTTDQFEQVQVFSRLGSLSMLLSRFDEALQLLQQATARGAGAKDERTISATLIAADWLALVYLLTGWPEKAVAMAEQTMHARQIHFVPGGKTRNLFTLCVGLVFSGHFDRASEYAEIGMKMTDRLGAHRESGMIHLLTAIIQLALANLDRAWEHINQAILMAESSGYDDLARGALALRGDISSLSDPTEAARIYEQAMPVHAESIIGGYIQYRLAHATARSGALEEGFLQAKQAVSYTNRVGFHLIRLHAEVVQADILRMRGQPEQAEEILIRLLPDLRERGLRQVVLAAEAALGEVYLALGRWDDAVECGQRVVSGAREISTCREELEGLALVARARRALGLRVESIDHERVLQLLAERKAHALLPETEPYLQHCSKLILSKLNG